MVISGEVIKKTFAKGSKSEHDAIYIVTDQGEFVLRKTDDNPFENKALQKFVGKKVNAEGKLKDYLFIADKVWTVE